jgi:DNA-binding CsgD family transcriptional regulator
MLAVEQPLVIAIDDVHWLDAASEAALCFVARRLSGEQVRFVLSQRTETISPLIQTLGPSRTRVLALSGLSFGAIRAILADQLDLILPRHVLRQLHESADGSPLFALEIGRVLSDRGLPAPTEPLPAPEDVQTLVRNRISALPDATREILLAAALLPRPDRSTLDATFAGGVGGHMRVAAEADVASFRGEAVVFSHPLHAAGVVASAADANRRAMHLRLADAAPDVERRAWHLARAADRPDDEIATVVAEGAAAAGQRGALHAAADLLERAGELTPATRLYEAHARRIEAADLHFHAGDPTHARALLERVLAEPLGPAQRAAAVRLVGEICISENNTADAERLLVEALSLTEDDRIRARIELELAYVIHFSFDFEGGAEHARRGLDLVSNVDDAPLLAEALAYCAISDYLAGRGVDWEKVDRALELEDPDRISLPGMPPSGVAGTVMAYVGRHEDARELMRVTCSRLSEQGEEKDLAHVLLWWSWLETRAGDFSRAAALADDAIACASVSGNRLIETWANAQHAWVDAHLGHDEEARRRIRESLEGDHPRVQLWAVTTLALLASSVPDYASAWEACRPFVEHIETARSIGEPVPLMFLPDAIEALIGLGEVERAEALLVPFETSARNLDRVWALATAARCRGLLHSARGERDAAMASLRQALDEHDRGELPFERARALLALGGVLRRARRRAEARAAVEEAIDEFERLGSTLWAARARAEVARISGRRPPTDGALTPSEQRTSELAAEGLSNKEIAARLVVSVHTVEVHLSRAYRKLGIRSRGQLADALASTPTFKD